MKIENLSFARHIAERYEVANSTVEHLLAKCKPVLDLAEECRYLLYVETTYAPEGMEARCAEANQLLKDAIRVAVQNYRLRLEHILTDLGLEMADDGEDI